MVTEAQKKATAKFERNNYDKVLLRLRRGNHPSIDVIKSHAENASQSLNAYILTAISERMEREG